MKKFVNKDWKNYLKTKILLEWHGSAEPAGTFLVKISSHDVSSRLVQVSWRFQVPFSLSVMGRPGHGSRPVRCLFFACATRDRGWHSKRCVRGAFNGMKTSRVFSFAAWHSWGSSTSTMTAVMPWRLTDSWVLVAGISGGIAVITKSGSIRKDQF